MSKDGGGGNFKIGIDSVDWKAMFRSRRLITKCVELQASNEVTWRGEGKFQKYLQNTTEKVGRQFLC